MCVYIHTYIHTHMHTYVHTYINTDLEAVLWLEEYLKGYPNTILLVSHDRAFLNEVTLT